MTAPGMLHALVPHRRTFVGDDGSPYLTRFTWGQLRLHIFHRGDGDPDPHDHPWDFWTFPLTSYVEEVAHPGGSRLAVVKAFRLHVRPAEHTHRVVGRWDGGRTEVHDGVWFDHATVDRGRIVTLVWCSPDRRAWGFLRRRGAETCWVPWRRYVFEDGKIAPCAPDDLRGAP